jgi:hypothetical protein
MANRSRTVSLLALRLQRRVSHWSWGGLALCLLLFTGCQGTAPSGRPPEDVAGGNRSAGLATEPVALLEGRYQLRGQIEGQYGIQMELVAEGKTLRGSYFYERSGAARLGEKHLTLTGQILPDGSLRLVEEAYQSSAGTVEKTGEFAGTWTRVDRGSSPGIVRLVGTWTRLRDRRTAPFELEQHLIEAGPYLLASATTEDRNESAGYIVTTDLPRLRVEKPEGDPALVARAAAFQQLLDQKVNPLLEEFRRTAIEDRPAILADPTRGQAYPPYSFEIRHRVIGATADYLSLLLTTTVFTGGAHPNTTSESLNWSISEGRPLTLAELFRRPTPPGRPGPETLLPAFCRRMLGRLTPQPDPAWVARGTAWNAENYQRWTMAPHGLQLTFDAYQVGSYAEGAHEVVIPYALLRASLDPEGPLRDLVVPALPLDSP